MPTFVINMMLSCIGLVDKDVNLIKLQSISLHCTVLSEYLKTLGHQVVEKVENLVYSNYTV